MQTTKSNAVPVDWENVRNAVAKNSQEGDYRRTAEILGVSKATVFKYMTGLRRIDTPAGINILNTFSGVVNERKGQEEKARLLEQAAAIQ